jgi:hypothetical protein
MRDLIEMDKAQSEVGDHVVEEVVAVEVETEAEVENANRLENGVGWFRLSQ